MLDDDSQIRKSKENNGFGEEQGDLSRNWSAIYKEWGSTRKGQENEAMSWQGISLSSCMLRKLFGTQR